MPKQILITTIVFSGLALGGCRKDQSDNVNQPTQAVEIDPNVLPRAEQEAQQQQAAAEPGHEMHAMEPGHEMGQATEPLDILVWPTVTIVGVQFECPQVDVHFETASAELDAADKADLDVVAACLKGTKNKEQIKITARTDPRGTESYNEQLSQRRAQAVAQYLQQQGVSAQNFQIRARGEQGVVEGIPALWPLQREAVVEPVTP